VFAITCSGYLGCTQLLMHVAMTMKSGALLRGLYTDWMYHPFPALNVPHAGCCANCGINGRIGVMSNRFLQ
jgi:hypothetical protein